MDSTIDQFRACPVGLLTNDYYDNIGTFIDEASEAGHDFVATPIAHPGVRRVLHEDKKDINKDAVNFGVMVLYLIVKSYTSNCSLL
ncbi:unnamed protein product [Absidia cylindrospora]